MEEHFFYKANHYCIVSELSSAILNAIFKFIIQRERILMLKCMSFLTKKNVFVPEVMDR